jgi:hypothetical protein
MIERMELSLFIFVFHSEFRAFKRFFIFQSTLKKS